MPRREREQERRQLVHIVVEFARAARPLDPAAVETLFVRHPWFEVSGGPKVIKGISQAPTTKSWQIPNPTPSGVPGAIIGMAVNSSAVIPAAVFTAAIADAPPPLVPTGWIGDSTNPYENDQETVRRQLQRLIDGPHDGVEAWLREMSVIHLDVVGATFDWRTLGPRIWLSGVRGACMLAVAYLVANTHGMLDELRWCDTCGPWMPEGGGRPTDRCECGAVRRRASTR